MLLGLGYSVISYPDILQVEIDKLKNISGVSHLPLNINMGLYLPFGSERNIYGLVINGDGDRFEASGEYFQINTYLVGLSIIHSLTGYTGKGVYLRGDGGIAFCATSSNITKDVRSDTGFGFRIGGGYSIPVSCESRIQIDLGYTYKDIVDFECSTLSLGIAILF